MKRTFLLVAALCIAVSVIITACKKPANSVTNNTTIGQLLGGLRTAPEHLSVAAGTDTIVYCTGGSRLHFYTYSFKDAAGNIISSGTVDLEVTEIYKTGDFMLNRTNTATVAFDSLLNSGGEARIAATMNGQPVYANRYGIGFTQSEASSVPMQLFYGIISNSDSEITWSPDYSPNTGTTASAATLDVSGYSIFRYKFDSCANFNWVNCDHFASFTSAKTNVTAVLPDSSFNASNTLVFIALPDYKVSLGLGVYSSSANSFSLNTHSYLPTGAGYEMVVMAVKNNQYYFYESTGIITNGITINTSMALKTESEILTMLQTLN